MQLVENYYKTTTAHVQRLKGKYLVAVLGSYFLYVSTTDKHVGEIYHSSVSDEYLGTIVGSSRGYFPPSETDVAKYYY
jgi:hypothetical protein